MSSALTGFVSGLSGRVDALEQNATWFTQQILQRPDLTDFSNLQIPWNSQFNALNNEVNRLKNEVSTLQNLVTNLSITITDNFELFTGHTGVLAIGAHGGLA